jgi:catechol 2,3-dioxygenase-like lactoylglutathione lyase family enzyme
MLATKPAVATAAVRDLAAARAFYEGVLGLTVTEAEGEEALTFSAGPSSLFVYRSQYAGTNQATAVTWDVGSDIVAIVDALKQKGLKFEHYDMPDLQREGDIYGTEGMRVAWFKDPDGNIHALLGK